MAKNKMPTAEEIEKLKSSFSSELTAINKAEKEDKSSPKQSFLSSISIQIEEALGKDTSYTGIKRAIKKIYNVDVSTQLIANFARNELGIEKRKKPNTQHKEESKKAQTSMEIKQEMANKPQDEETL
jgi:hypothetical protein